MTSSVSVPSSGINTNARILLVADQSANLAIMTGILTGLGFWLVDHANNGVSALLLFRSGIYDLVVFDGDIGMMGGFAAVRRMRGFEEGQRHTPILAITPHAASGDRENSLKAGMDDHLSKPLDAARLRKALAQYVPGTTPFPASGLRLVSDTEQRELLTLATHCGNSALDALGRDEPQED